MTKREEFKEEVDIFLLKHLKAVESFDARTAEDETNKHIQELLNIASDVNIGYCRKTVSEESDCECCIIWKAQLLKLLKS